jgi:glyoxylase-like metal-dependent hydrolase (beta-lactamase superfamily II)
VKSMKKEFSFKDRFENVFMLGNGHVPAFLYCGEKPVLFDPGVSAFGPLYLEKIIQNLKDPSSLILALTHSHFDHCGAAPYLLRNIPGIKVAASEKAADVILRPNAVKLMEKLNQEYEKEMKDELKGEDVSFEAFEVDFRLKEGDRLELGNDYSQVFETPGHTRDCLSYFFPEKGVFFCGESAGVAEGSFIHTPFLTSFEDYLSSLKKIAGLKPKVLCIAHNGILSGEDINLFISEAIDAVNEYRGMIENYLNKYNGEQDKVVGRITLEEYDSKNEHMQNRDPFMLNLRAKVSAVARMMEGL